MSGDVVHRYYIVSVMVLFEYRVVVATSIAITLVSARWWLVGCVVRLLL